ncbi:MAG: bifunctional DNA-formamidopyrimidine glycosylase/DNA-(apurinic or apyrimidinic site) lyase [bacterium]|nr:bifunctional DNA-formamidopyrimidine glycosylase/DNA-(apurinic or apyrimidinic site) lyase [bacterium]
MPELPEVETVVRELLPRLKNRVIKKVEVRSPKIVALGPKSLSNIRSHNLNIAQRFVKTLTGLKVSNVKRRAKLIIIDLGGKYSILIHLKMTDQLIFLDRKNLAKPIKLRNSNKVRAKQLPDKSTHVIFELNDGAKLFYNDIRQFGYLKLVADNQIEQVKELKEFGPEPLDINFAIAEFMSILDKHAKVKIKQLLMNPKAIAGIGNIYSDEILFFAKLKPIRVVRSLTQPEQTRLFRGIKKILTRAVQKAGSSVGDFIRPSGDWGKYGLYHKVYGRSGKKCFRCGTMIKSLKLGGRTGSFCPKCQK